MHKQTQIWSLYRITNKINGKIYIGQAADLSKRWSDHRRAVKLNKPTQAIHYAMIKYGLENFEFEVIASCNSQNNANEIETELVSQYNSFIKNGKGYNVTLGGMNAPKTEVFKQMMRDWHASLTPEERAEISKKQSDATQQQIATKGHPGLGSKRTDEQKANISAGLKARDYDVVFSEEVRKHMSEAHIGHKQSEETKIKRFESTQKTIEQKRQKLIEAGILKCFAPGCEISGKAKYKIINGVRYCNKHGLRMLRYGRLDCLSD